MQIEGATVVEGRDTVAGPALELVGCGANQRAVAGFLAALRDIDGVTRVGIAASERPSAGDTALDSGTANASSDCRTRDAIAKFEVVVAFDAVPVPAVPARRPSRYDAWIRRRRIDRPPTPGRRRASPRPPRRPPSSSRRATRPPSRPDEARNAANVVPGVAR